MNPPLHNVYYSGPATNWDEAIGRLWRHRGPIAVDTETIALNGKKKIMEATWDEDGEETIAKVERDARTCIGIGVAISETEAFYFPLGRTGWVNVPKSDPYPLVALLESPDITKVFFNSMFDIDRIEDAFEVDASNNFEDTAIACQVQGLWNSLERNSVELLGELHYEIDDVLPSGKNMLDVPFPITAQKCIWDCMTTMKLYNLMKMREWGDKAETIWTDYKGRQFDANSRIKDCYRVDKLNVPLLRKMTARGFAIDEREVQRWNRKLTREISRYDDFFKPLGVNPQSNDQLGYYLATERGHYIGLTPTKKHMQVTEDVIRAIGDPVGFLALARRKRQKLKSTYVTPFMGKDRDYSHFRLDLATGRLGSYSFNSQNFPARMRGIFKPESGKWTWLDLHQAEMRVWAWQAQDKVMLDAFAKNQSPHDTTMAALYPGVAKKLPNGETDPRYTESKSYNFALLADASANVLAKTTGKSVAVCQEYKDILYAQYWRSKQHQDYIRRRHRPEYFPDYVEDDYGRRCHIPDSSPFTDEMHQQKCRLNYPFQATVAGVVKRMMIILDQSGYDMVCQVHDEILVNGDVEFPNWIADLHPSIPMPFEVEHRPDKRHPEPRWE